jgi:branched-chain amino acid transport system ATP-binding protein
MLELNGVSVRYGAIQALRQVSMRVGQGEIVCLIGANGAGKSTVLNAISGVVGASAGSIVFEGADIRGARASAIVRKGLVQVPEGRLVFPDMTVLENLEMGAYSRRDATEATLAMVLQLFPRLEERKAQLAGLMSGGEQQMLAIGRALMAAPRMLLLDEPSMGLAPLVIADIFRTLARLRTEFGLSILLVEQNARAALMLADRGYVLTNGAITHEGASKALLADSATQEAFLGRARAVASA